MRSSNLVVPSHRNTGGFTLLELLIAMALLVIICGALYGTYFSLMNGREAAVAGMENRREIRTTLDMLRREINAAYYKRNLNPDQKKTYFIVQDRDFFGKPASILKLSTIAAPTVGTTPVSDLLEVTYEPMEKDNRISLTRRAKDFYFDFTPDPYPQMEEVEGFLVECWDGSKWVKSWDTALNNTLPKSVKVTVRVKERDKTVEYSAVATPQIDLQ